MAIVKCVTSGSPMSNIFNYIMRDEATETKLIDGIGCMPESALDEFREVKARYNKQDGRQYYHFIQSFDPQDKVTPEEAHEIGLEFAEHFSGFQMVLATHTNAAHLHNHIILNSVSYENGRKFHMSHEDLIELKRYSNEICRRHGLSTTEEKSRYGNMPKWKRQMKKAIEWAMQTSATRKEFIRWLNNHGYSVKWIDGYKYLTFKDNDGHVCRDNKLFDERFLKNNLEIYFALGGCRSELAGEYFDYKTPEHKPNANMTITTGLINLLGNALSIAPPQHYYTPETLPIHDRTELDRLEEILGRKISVDTFMRYRGDKDEQELSHGLYL